MTVKTIRAPVVWGTLLILAGLFLLAQNFNVFGELSAPIWAAMFAAASLAFFAAFATQRSAWWFLIPAFVFAGLAGTVLLAEFAGQGELAGSVFLWAIAAGFWAVYLVEPNNWWAVIPAGVLTTIGVMPVIADRLQGTATGAVFFLGLGLTFGLLYLLRGRHGRATAWAVFPAAACLGMALVLGVFGPFNRFWPVIFLILPGAYLLFIALRPRAGSGSASPSGGSDGAPSA